MSWQTEISSPFPSNTRSEDVESQHSTQCSGGWPMVLPPREGEHAPDPGDLHLQRDRDPGVRSSGYGRPRTCRRTGAGPPEGSQPLEMMGHTLTPSRPDCMPPQPDYLVIREGLGGTYAHVVARDETASVWHRASIFGYDPGAGQSPGGSCGAIPANQAAVPGPVAWLTPWKRGNGREPRAEAPYSLCAAARAVASCAVGARCLCRSWAIVSRCSVHSWKSAAPRSARARTSRETASS